VLVAACLLILVGGLGVVWLAGRVDQRHVAECQYNLHQFHGALVAYADLNNGKFPQVERQPPRNFAGSFIPALNEAGVLLSGVTASCPAENLRSLPSITFEQLEDLRRNRPDDYRDATRALAGCYAYSLGYRDTDRGNHLGLTRTMDGLLPIMADAPTCRSANDVSPGNSPNHGGRGQNVLYIDGHVEFKETRQAGLDGDDIYLNADHRVGAGRGPRDTVLGRSDAVPYPIDE
jgi:prepilin-type processing-associated H-X9-DG protein